MNSYLKKLIQDYKNKGLLIDANLLLLYIVGSFDIELVSRFSRTAKFTIDDFYIVSDFIDLFKLKITTPHILTEVSNLIGNRDELQGLLIIYIKTAEEKFLKSIKIAENNVFSKFGLADTATIETAKDSYLIFTDDKPLYGYLINKGIDAVNFDDLRITLA
jgi:hypothetical protein